MIQHGALGRFYRSKLIHTNCLHLPAASPTLASQITFRCGRAKPYSMNSFKQECRWDQPVLRGNGRNHPYWWKPCHTLFHQAKNQSMLCFTRGERVERGRMTDRKTRLINFRADGNQQDAKQSKVCLRLGINENIPKSFMGLAYFSIYWAIFWDWFWSTIIYSILSAIPE